MPEEIGPFDQRPWDARLLARASSGSDAATRPKRRTNWFVLFGHLLAITGIAAVTGIPVLVVSAIAVLLILGGRLAWELTRTLRARARREPPGGPANPFGH